MLITQMDALRRVFGTVELSTTQWVLSLVPALLLLCLWELGKLIARRRVENTYEAIPAATDIGHGD